jgi:hypothetical protein
MCACAPQPHAHEAKQRVDAALAEREREPEPEADAREHGQDEAANRDARGGAAEFADQRWIGLEPGEDQEQERRSTPVPRAARHRARAR